MKDKLMKYSVKMQVLLMSEEGQDLIEYALVVALIAFAATAGMTYFGDDHQHRIYNIGTTLGSYIT